MSINEDINIIPTSDFPDCKNEQKKVKKTPPNPLIFKKKCVAFLSD